MPVRASDAVPVPGGAYASVRLVPDLSRAIRELVPNQDQGPIRVRSAVLALALALARAQMPAQRLAQVRALARAQMPAQRLARSRSRVDGREFEGARPGPVAPLKTVVRVPQPPLARHFPFGVLPSDASCRQSAQVRPDENASHETRYRGRSSSRLRRQPEYRQDQRQDRSVRRRMRRQRERWRDPY